MTFDDVTVDEVRRWWNGRPCNSSHSDAPIHSLRYTLETTFHRYYREPHIPRFAGFDQWRDCNIVEAGCGIGTDTLQFAFRAQHVVALDVSGQSLDIARQRAQALRLSNRISFHQVDLEQPLQFYIETGWPDLIYSFGALHHTPHPDDALHRLREIAGEHTELRIMLYHRWSTKGLRLGLTNRRIAAGSEARAGSPVTYAYSRRAARRLLENSGWRVQRIEIAHIFPWSIAWLKSGQYRYGFPWNHVPQRVRYRLSRVLGWHLLITAYPKKEA